MIFDLVNLKKYFTYSNLQIFNPVKIFESGHFYQDLQFSAGLNIHSVKNLLHQIFLHDFYISKMELFGEHIF